jgi:hypothetical protein
MDRFSPDVTNGARPLPESYALSALGIALRLKRQSNKWKIWNRASRLEGRRSIQLSYGRAAQSASKTFYGVRRTQFDFENEQFSNAASGRGCDKKSSGTLDS